MLWSVLRLNADSLEEAMKFLVLWHFDLTRLGAEVTRAVIQMPEYAKKLGDKLECPYHVIGSHGRGFTRLHRTKNLIGFWPCRLCTTMPLTKFWRWQRWKTRRRSRGRRASRFQLKRTPAGKDAAH